MPTTLNKRYGWRVDVPDHRDRLYSVQASLLFSLPSSTDLRQHCPPIYDQGQLGSCTANAICAALEFDQIKQNLPVYTPSRLFLYYNERAMEGDVESDAGAMIRTGIKSANSQGDCAETLWPYDISQFTVKPPDTCYTDANNHRTLIYYRIQQSLMQLQGCLASGFPFVFGISVYASFESNDVARTGIVPMPGYEELLGGHAILCVGYDTTKQQFLCRNSWGTSWGQNGYFWLPFAYVLSPQLANDFWTIRSIR